MSENGLFPESYKDFLKRRNDAQGYDFQHAPGGSAPPPTVSFREKLRWWTWDRWKRKKVIRQERDRRVEDIFQIRKGRGLDPKER
jgi:hypothetical protein